MAICIHGKLSLLETRCREANFTSTFPRPSRATSFLLLVGLMQDPESPSRTCSPPSPPRLCSPADGLTNVLGESPPLPPAPRPQKQKQGAHHQHLQHRKVPGAHLLKQGCWRREACFGQSWEGSAWWAVGEGAAFAPVTGMTSPAAQGPAR